MDDKYDCIVLGTGLKECILSGILSVEGKKVLHIDRNDYYGGDTASLTLKQLYEKFGRTPNDSLGNSRDYSVDMIPKFIMSSGLLVQILVKTDVTRYLEFKAVDGSFVQHAGRVYKIPSDKMEALKSSLMGMFEKRRCGKFLEFVGDYDEKNPATHQGLDLRKKTAREVFAHFGLKPDTIEFVGHSMALQSHDAYLDKPALETIKLIRLYAESVLRFGKSPYIYPLYGLSEIPQGFARLAAIHGGTYMLNKPVDKIIYENGKAVGVQCGQEVAKGDFIVCDPSYVPDKVKKNGKVVRCICILDHPINDTFNAESCQIIVPQREAKRTYDIYISCVSFAHKVASNGKYIALVSTTVETNNPEAELNAGLKLLAPIKEKFVSVEDLYEPISDGTDDNVFISKSYDAETHFKQSCQDIMDIYKRITGKDLDLTPPPKKEEE